jgi:hypothetical protein
MSDITDWEPEMTTEINCQERYESQLRLSNQWLKAKEASEQEFRLFKAEAIATLKAIDMCILASLNTEKQHLNHRARNFRMRHVHQIIGNQIDVFCDRKLTTYEDDF